MMLVPLIGVFLISHIGKPEGYRSPRWMKGLFIPAFLLSLLVFTNDRHQLVFTFPGGLEAYNQNYGYGPLYVPIIAWYVLLALYFVIMLLVKSRVPVSKSFRKLPLFIAVTAIIFWYGYALRLYQGDLTANSCLFIAALVESAIQCGLIPSNMYYNELFRRSSIAAQIIDKDLRIHYASAAAARLNPATMQRSLREDVALDDTVLHSQPIRGGYVLWQNDVRAINELAAHLRDANELLGERYDLLKAEVELKERRLHAEEKSRLYDRIAREIASRLNKADALLQKSREEPERANELLAQICVISAHIKRRVNLILLAEEKTQIQVKELESCLRESLDNLRLCSVLTYLDFRCDSAAGIQKIIGVYDLFEEVTEMLLGQLTAMMVTAESAENHLHFRIQAGCTSAPPRVSFSLPGGTVTWDYQDEDLILQASLDVGGDGV